jgi:uncharacterized protein YjbJ (UPF0337 family)
MSGPGSALSLGGLTDRIKGTVKQVAGTVLGNEGLKREGVLHHEKVDAAKASVQAEAEATREHAEAKLNTREREIEIERQRIGAETAADSRVDEIERSRAVEERQIVTEAAQREAAVERTKTAEQSAAAQQERAAAHQRLQAGRRASELEAEAKRAEMAADVLDTAAEERP